MTVQTVFDVAYLPRPNRVEIVLTDELPDPALTPTAFLIPVFDDGSVLLAQNRKRGLEVPGGHVEPGETHLEAALREAREEAGVLVTDIVPIGYQRGISDGAMPEGYRYPFPVSYQQFYAGRVRWLDPNYIENDECLAPVKIPDLIGQRPSIQIFGARARVLLRK